jgi:hypothetical protein
MWERRDGFDECRIAFDVGCGVLKLCIDLIHGFEGEGPHVGHSLGVGLL